MADHRARPVDARRRARSRHAASGPRRAIVATVVAIGLLVPLALLPTGAGSSVAAAPGCGRGGVPAADLNAFFAAAGLGATPVDEGFGGGDYPHAYPLPDGRILWILQDLHFSNDDVLGATNAVHNGAILQEGRCWTIQGRRGQDFIGDAVTVDSRRWFWPLDGEVAADGNLWVFMAEMINPNGNGAAIGARSVRTWRAIIDPVTLNQLAFDPAPDDSPRHYGQSIVSTDRYTYLYGNCYQQFVGAPTGPSEFDPCMRDTYLARVPLRRLWSTPSYWNGSDWVADRNAARPVMSRGEGANLMNVQWFGDRFVNVSKIDEWWGADIRVDVATAPQGPWTTVDRIDIVPDRKCERCGIYGAFLMPYLDHAGDMTIAVSNGTDYATWRNNAFLYRPTFYGHPVPEAPIPLAGATPPDFDLPDGEPGSGFVAVDPERLLDTREPDQAIGRLRGGQEYRLDLSDHAPDGATAAILNLAATDATERGYLRAYACSDTEPTTSSLNPAVGIVVSNAAIVPLGDGVICFRSLHDTHLVVDLNGWMATESDVGLHPISPRRLVDTRSGVGGSARLDAGDVIEVAPLLAGSNATGVALSVTAVDPSASGYVTAWPCGIERPIVANLNITAGVTRPNFVNVRVGDGDTVCLYTFGETDLVVDVLGEYRPGAPARYAIVGPVRLLDTRTDGHRHHSSNLAELIPLGDVVGAQLNLTATNPTRNGYLTGYGCLTEAWPGTANVNYALGDTSTSLALVAPSNGYGCVFSAAPTNVVVDLFGVWQN